MNREDESFESLVQEGLEEKERRTIPFLPYELRPHGEGILTPRVQMFVICVLVVIVLNLLFFLGMNYAGEGTVLSEEDADETLRDLFPKEDLVLLDRNEEE